MPLDLLALSIDMISLLSLCSVAIIGSKAVRSFQQSKQAVVESATLLSVIVDALTSRIQRSESALTKLRSDIATAARQSDVLETEQAHLHAAYEQMMNQLQGVLSTDKKLIMDLETLKTRLSEVPHRQQTVDGLPRRENFATVLSEGDILAALTPTERRTLEILRGEGSKGAPELGKRLQKSREHTSRLMKKLYMEGYVHRESNRSPFRYKLNDEVRLALESGRDQITAERPEMP
jgi:DNA-binding transcriptional ArsR family regulator